MDEDLSMQQEAEVIEPQKMSDEDFKRYLNDIREGSSELDEEQPEAEADEETPAEENKPDEAEENTDKHAAAEKLFTQADIDRIVGERLSREREKHQTGTRLSEELGREALRFYDAEDEDAAISRLISDLKGQNADKMEMSEEEYHTHSELEDKARRYDEEQARIQEVNDEVRRIQGRWERESAELRDIVPDFDFKAAMETDADFKDAILKGKSVQTAYMIASKKAAVQPRRTIAQNATAKRSGAPKAEFNPATASRKDFLDYINRIKDQE